MLRLLSLLIFKINSWNVEDKVTYPKKCIIIAAPHTSNWDFLIGRCYGYIQKIHPKYLIKSEVFYPIIGTLLKLNGIQEAMTFVQSGNHVTYLLCSLNTGGFSIKRVSSFELPIRVKDKDWRQMFCFVYSRQKSSTTRKITTPGAFIMG